MLAGLLRRLIRSGTRYIPDGEIAAQQAALKSLEFSPETVLRATANGFFPMPNRSGKIEWRCPAKRALIPVDAFHIRKSLRRVIRSRRFEVRIDTAFDEVIAACAERPETWITPQLADVYRKLFRMGNARSVEAWQNGELVGGVYGLCIGRYFVSESQFHRVNHAGKVCFATLFEILRANNFLLHDVQYPSSFLSQFGTVELERGEFQRQLSLALAQPARFELPSKTIERVVDRFPNATEESSGRRCETASASR
ncbi:MAG: leucyl/phenylalanyl-tRNA--protein transferase [Rhodopirellula sp.]|nr:leucyl/phenylalanyl-tRNA--protein transferase [Rhodopirellula sp.]